MIKERKNILMLYGISFFLILLAGLLTIFIRKPVQPPEQTQFTAAVSDVRVVTTDPSSATINGSPITGAIIGHAVAGKVGMVLGAASQTDEILHISGLVACSFTATLPSGETMTYRLPAGDKFYSDGPAKVCSTLRSGDKVQVQKIGDGYEWISGY